MIKIETIPKREILVSSPLLQRGSELASLRKFHGIDNIPEIIGKYGCYLKKCGTNVSENFDLYHITTGSDTHFDQDDILAAAVPINYFVFDSSPMFEGWSIIDTCLIKHIPLFIIAQNSCHLYHIKKCEINDEIAYECPGIRDDKNFKCKANKKKFCQLIQDRAYKKIIQDLLTLFEKHTGSASFPVFELSSFINFCISAHYFQAWSSYKNEGFLEKENKLNVLKAATSATSFQENS
jgi:hypothetical protein